MRVAGHSFFPMAILAMLAALTFWLDPEGMLLQSLIRFPSGSMPKQVVFTPDGKELWMSLLGGRGLEIYDPYTGKLLDSVRLGTLGGAVEVIFMGSRPTSFTVPYFTASGRSVTVLRTSTGFPSDGPSS